MGIAAESRVAIGFGIGLATLAAIGGMAYRAVVDLLETVQWIEHTHEARITLERTLGELLAASANARGYVLTGEDAYLDAYAGAPTRIGEDFLRLRVLTADNALQQARLDTLRSQIDERQVLLEQIIAARRNQGLDAARTLLLGGGSRRGLDAIRSTIGAMEAEEDRLLIERKAASQQSTGQLFITLVLFAVTGVLSYVGFMWRMVRDVATRRRIEADLAEAAHYDGVLGEALSLFNSSREREHIVADVLKLLAGTGVFPVSAFFRHDEWSASLQREAAWGVSSDLPMTCRMGEGLIGQAAQANQLLCLSDAEAALRLDTGLLVYRPAAVLLVPVRYQERLLGILVLATVRGPGARDRAFVERLGAQLGVALHNLQQYDDLRALAEQLRQRGEEIARQNQQLEAAGRMKSEFLATMSHELRTPLNAIIGFSALMRDGLTGDLPADQKEYISEICSSGEHLLSLINDLLDLSKVEAGAMVLETETVTIEPLLQNALVMVRDRAMTHRLRLRLELDNDLTEIEADARKCKQILYNLLSNAVKFTADGGEIVVRARRVGREQMQPATGEALWLPVTPASDATEFLEVAVSDTGIGIGASDLSRLFQPFVQLDSALSRRYTGTGLGLVMVKALVDLHGGTLAVASMPGQGSTFTVWLPYRTPATTSETKYGTAGSRTLALVVEDEPRARELISLHLAAEGFRVTCALTAEDGLAQARSQLPDLITLDLLMPGMDGWAFLAQLKAESLIATIPVVILSIMADDSRARGFALGASQVLQKPFEHQELVDALAAMGFPLTGQVPTALVVDDDPRAVEMLAMTLEQTGCAVLRAYGGREGIEVAQRAHPTLILLDLMMPDVSGFEVVDALKRDPATADISILIVTARQIDATEREALNGRILRVMEKSTFQPEDFIHEVRRALRRT